MLDLLGGVGARTLSRTGAELDAELDRVLELVEAGVSTPDRLALESGLDPGRAAVALARLELLGYLSSSSSGAYSPTGLHSPG